MVKVHVEIKGTEEYDVSGRDWGRRYDANCPIDAEPSRGPSEFFIGTNNVHEPFYYAEDVELDYGTHTICVAPGCYDPYRWKVEVLVDGKSLGEKSGINLGREGGYIDPTHHYTATFTLEKPTPTLADTINQLISTIVPVMMLMMILPMLTGLIKKFKRTE
jgi:hypothetical protein